MQDEEYKQFREIIRTLEKKAGLLEDIEYSCCGITIAQCYALIEIGRAGSISLNELAESINLESSTVSRTVNNLVTSGLAVRDQGTQDRRYISISLTEDGNALFGRIDNGMDRYYKEIFSQIPENKKYQVIESLTLIIEAINKSGVCCEGSCCN